MTSGRVGGGGGGDRNLQKMHDVIYGQPHGIVIPVECGYGWVIFYRFHYLLIGYIGGIDVLVATGA